MTNEIFIEQGDHALLFFHSYTSTSKDFIPIIRRIEEEGYTIYAPHLSGHGEADPASVLDYTMDDWTQDGENALQFLKDKGYEKISVFGLSLGGVIATYLALEHPEIESAGTFSSPVMSNRATTLIPSFRAWYVKHKQEVGLTKEEAIDRFENQDKERLLDMKEDMRDFIQGNMLDRYDTIEMDYFVGQGGNDQLIDETQSKEFAKELVNADVTYKFYEGAGHVITVGRAGRELREDLIDFLK